MFSRRFRHIFSTARSAAPSALNSARPEHGLAFLLGIGKSGTNWAGSLLNLHPAIHCDGEFHFQYFFEAHARFTGGWWLAGNRPKVANATRAMLEELVRQGMAAAAESHPRAQWIIDRTPRTFQVLIPGAPHFYIMRDGRDVLVSFTFHQLRTASPDDFPPDARQWFTPHWEAFQRDPQSIDPGNPGLLGQEHWVRYHARRWATQLARDLSEIEAARAADTPSPTLTIRYEDLHTDTELWRHRMYEHLGLDPGVAAPLSAESRTTPGFEKEDRTNFYRRGQTGDWQSYATDNFRRWFKEEAGEALIERGYESTTW
jgi:hypothetical protein